jgi:hypothetical protein
MSKPWLAIALAVVAATCLVGSTFSHRWLAPDHAPDDGFSPRSFQVCGYQGDDVVACEVGGNGTVVEAIDRSAGGSPPTSPMFVPSGTLAFLAAVAAAAALLASAVLGAAGKRDRFAPKVATLAVIVAGIGAGLFLASKPGMSPAVGGPFHVGYAVAIFAVGAITGLVAARWLARALRPAAVKKRRP